MAIIDHDAALARAGANVTGFWSQAVFLARRYPLGAAGAFLVTVFVLTAVVADVIAPTDPTATNSKFSLAHPGSLFWLGADFIGRDMYSRIVHGARISLALGARALGLGAVLGSSLCNTIITIAIPLVPTVARVVRSSSLSLREQPFFEAARAVGMGEVRIAVRHVLPNTLAPLIVLGTAQLGSAILTEASLSFLGLGIPEPYPSWGRMLSESAAEYVRTAPWLVIFPGIAISLAVFGTNLFGDALRDILDPRQRG